ncbi:MAG: Omp28 family outer membrane lipoprotein [bacterium]
MKIYLKFSIYLTIALIIVSACDVIEPNNYLEDPNANQSDTNNRKVLLEDFTGYRCGNCPYAAEVAHQLENLYAGRVLSIGVHIGYYAEPQPPFSQEYRSETGNEIDAIYKISEIGTPNGLINREVHDTKLIKEKDSWAQFTVQELKKPANMKFGITTSYNNTTKTISADIAVKYVNAQTNQNQYLAVYVVEDSVVGYQTWYNHTPEDNEDYVHHNVLRTSMNGTWGEKLSTENISANKVFNKHYELQIPSTANWRAKKLKIVAFVYQDNGGNTKPIENVDWVNLNVVDDVIPDTNPLIITYSTGDTLYLPPLSFRFEWKVNLKNPSEKDVDVQVGYNVIQLADGHSVSMCVGLCYPPKNENFLVPSTFIIKPGESTSASYITLDVTPLDATKIGETIIDFIYYPKGQPLLVKTKRVHFII